MSLHPDVDLVVVGPEVLGMDEVLTTEALEFIAALTLKFRTRRDELLAARRQRQARFDAGELPDFLPQTADIRADHWRAAPLPADLLDRRVEITGPVDRKMIINALNSGAKMFMADFEDSSSPTWANMIAGQKNLMDAVRRTITFTHPRTGKHYQLAEQTATLLVRPRGLHLPEAHVEVAGIPVPASFFDFGLYFFHNAAELIRRGSGPYFYLPKLEHHLEARLWNDVFVFAQESLGIPVGTIKATCLLETLPAAFQMDEILFELRQHSAGLNCGRWDYIFSFIKTLGAHPGFLLPDRGQVGMTQSFMRAYTTLVIQTCHRRGVHAMGGMAAQIPIKHDPVQNAQAMAKVDADKHREVSEGHDGTWVAHPGLIGLAMEVFDQGMPGDNQIDRVLPYVNITAADLLSVPDGSRTEAGLRLNISVGIRYIEAWLRGSGCVPLFNLMEDAATAEISRSQVWQWLRHGADLEDGRIVTPALFTAVLAEELAAIEQEVGTEHFAAGRFGEAAALFSELACAEHCPDFLTLPAYQRIIS